MISGEKDPRCYYGRDPDTALKGVSKGVSKGVNYKGR